MSVHRLTTRVDSARQDVLASIEDVEAQLADLRSEVEEVELGDTLRLVSPDIDGLTAALDVLRDELNPEPDDE